MASSIDKLRELDLTREEVDRIGEALKNKEFRKLLTDYVEEIQDPENRKLYEKEITQLEKERGNDVVFIHPKPGYVLKTSINGSQKCFINICVNELIDRPNSIPSIKDGSKGFQWSLPHSISPAREDLDNKKIRCLVYDVVFHPETLQLADKNKSFRTMINNTAMEAVESNHNVKLDMKNVKFPKLQFKGVPRACVRRTPSKNPSPVERGPEEKEFFDQLYKHADSYNTSPKKNKKPRKLSVDDKSHYTTPKYIIKHRSHVDIQDCTEHKEAKMNIAIPKELIIEVNLPMLKSSGDITLDVTEKTVQLVSEKPAKYKLNITLPYNVNEASGNAKFDKDLKKLIITLPVKRNTNFLLSDCSVEDSGVESDHGSPGSVESEEENSVKHLISEVKPSEQPIEKSAQFRTKFLDANLLYNNPEYTCHVFENIIAFTLNVKNVDDNTIEKLFDASGSSIHVKFTSISASYYPTYYAFYIKLQKHYIKQSEVLVEAWDNNVVVQIPFEGNPKELTNYLYGLDENNLKERYIDEPCIINEVLQEDKPLETIKEEQLATQESVLESNTILEENPKSKAIDIVSSYESSGDELSCGSFSPAKSKGILKRFSSKRSAVVRSISESSLDDFVPSSFENCHTSLDSVIPEDSEVSTSLKKTVRFNDNIKRQLYRSNSSILGQKKKNQRKARNKKRANERRHSESELSEVEEKQEGDLKTSRGAGTDEASVKSKGSQNDIFQLDMDH